jgi:superfamily II DNA or RNA helicase
VRDASMLDQIEGMPWVPWRMNLTIESGEALYGAADRLAQSGGVLEVRVLQGGQIVTGIVGADGTAKPGAAKFRVYIRGAQRECSCGARGDCVHIAAVSIVAARTGSGNGAAAQSTRGSGVRGAPAGPPVDAGTGASAGVGAGAGTGGALGVGVSAGTGVGPGVAASTSTGAAPGVGAGAGAAPAAGYPAGIALGARAYAAAPGGPTQQLCYLLNTDPTPGNPLRGIRVSVWVAQRGSDVGSLVPGSACAFALRRASVASAFEFPRYVDQADREILPALPSGVEETIGADALIRIVSTGRAFLGTLDGAPLRIGESRAVTLIWKTLAGGDQVLGWEEEQEVLLGLEPPLYVDPRTGVVGSVELACDVAFAREMRALGSVAPELVEEVNGRIAGADIRAAGAAAECAGAGGGGPIGAAGIAGAGSRAAGVAAEGSGVSSVAGADVRAVGAEGAGANVGAGDGDPIGASGSAGAGLAAKANFPRLQTLTPIADSLRSITPRLVLSGDEQAILYFVYNGTPVDSRRLSDLPGRVRFVADTVLYEVPRDLAAEATFRSQLAELPTGRLAWLQFMMKRVPALQGLGWAVDVENSFPYRIVTATQWYGDLGADQRQAAWFNLRLGVMVDGQPVNLLPALTRYLKSSLEADADADGCRIAEHWLVRLADGRYLPIEIERIQRIGNTLIELLERDDSESLSLPRSQSGRLAALNLHSVTAQDASLTELVDDLRNFSGIQALQPPSSFHGSLRHYQQEGLGWLQFLRRFRLGGILADDMGLGKTVQTIAHITTEIESGRLQKPVLIVAPVSALGNWKQELTRFAPGLSVFTWHGAQRRKSLPRLKDTQVIITAYPLLLIDSEIWMARDFGLVILDEAQMIKNPASKVSQMARTLRADSRLCLSGTPVENHLGELWSLFDFLQPGLLGDERHFQRLYRTPIEKNGDRARATSLSARLAPFLLRRTKDAVAKELPPKVEIIEPITLDEKQRDFYDGVRLAMHQRILEIVREQGLARSQITILDALLKLRQVCCDPRLVKAEEAVPSAKLEWLSTVLPELMAEGRRILLFSQFTSMLRLIEATVTALDIPYCLLTGETTDRTAVVQRFQSGEVPLFLISLKAGGTALNLTAADTVIHYDPWWNPAVEAQATDRAHRIGQTKSVFVYKLIAQDTVEERMLQLQADKRMLADHLYTQKSASPTALGVEDLEMLLAP